MALNFDLTTIFIVPFYNIISEILLPTEINDVRVMRDTSGDPMIGSDNDYVMEA